MVTRQEPPKIVITNLALLLVVTIILSFLPAFFLTASGQSVNANVSNTPGISFAQDIAVSGDNQYVAWQDFTPGNSEIFLASSHDGGVAFGESVNVSNTTEGDSSLPNIVAAGDSVYVVWQDTSPTSDIFFASSTDGGATFGEPINVSNQGASSIPQIAVSGDDVYVVWADSSAGNPDIFFASSTDGGATFGEPVNVSNTPDGFSYLPQAAVSSNGTIYLAWQDNFPVDDIFFASSIDGGTTFSEPVNISNTSEGSSFSPILAASGNSVYVTWQDTFPTNDVYVVSSTDGGSSFNEAVNVSNNTEISVSPVLAVSETDPSKVFVAWSDNTNTQNSFFDIFYASSTDGGLTFSEVINVSNNAGTSSTPQIAVDSSDNVYLAWVDDTADVSNSEILLASSLDEFACAVNISNNPTSSSLPLLAVPTDSGKVHVLWQDLVDPLDPGNSEIVIRSNFDPSLPSITIDSVSVNSVPGTTPKWDIDSVEISGTLGNPAEGDSVNVNWGDGTETEGIPISGCAWGPVEHTYSSSALASNPLEITAELVNDTGDQKAISHSPEINVQKHSTNIELNAVLSAKEGSDLAVSGVLTDSDSGQAVEGLTIAFDGSGAAGILEPTLTQEDGSFNSVGIAPAPAEALQVQAHFEGNDDFQASDSTTQTYDSVNETAIQFNVTSGLLSHVDLSGFSFNASIDFEEVISDGAIFASECTSPDSSRYTSLDMCLQISSAVQMAEGSEANITMAFVGSELPSGISATDVDIFHEKQGPTIVDITRSRNETEATVTGTATTFSKFITGIALHSAEPDGAHRQQVFLGDGHVVSHRDITNLQNSSATAVASFDRTSYRASDSPVLTIDDGNGNIDPGKIDIVYAAVKSETSDPFVLEMQLSENEINSGIFTATFSFTEGETSSENGVLQARPGDVLSVHYISGVRASAVIDGVAESGLIQLSDYIVDEGICLKPIGGAFNLEFIDAQLGPNGKITVTISYANSNLRGFDPSSFRMVHKEDARWVDITLPDPDGHDLDAMTITGETTTSGPFSLAVDLDDCSGGSGGGLARPGTGLVLDFAASLVKKTTSSGSSGGGGGGGGGGSTVTLQQTHDAAYFEENPLAKFSNDAVAIVAADGESSDSEPVHSGDEVKIQSTISNHQSGVPQPYAWIVQVVDKNGATVSLEMQEGSLDPGRSATLSILWTAEGEPGMYTIHIFTWDAIEDNPSPLSEAHVSILQVQGT